MTDWRAGVRGAAGPVALVTVLATEGSAPRGAGARMTVTAEATTGTIGGGALEWRAIGQARAMLAQPAGSWRVQDYPLGPLLGQCCGGRVRLLVEHLAGCDWIDAIDAGVETHLGDVVSRRCVDLEGHPGDIVGPIAAHAHSRLPNDSAAAAGVELLPLLARGDRPARFREPTDGPRRPLMLFGAGHVGGAIARVLPGLPFDLAWFDSRPELATIPGVIIDEEAALVACAAAARPGTAVLILTHDHALDYRLTAAALGSGAGFVGLIGSETKRARFQKRLAIDGIDGSRLTCPIGIARIPGKAPAVIAISVAAQLLALGLPD